METRNLGPSDLKVSVVGLGCNNFGTRLDLEGSRAVIDKAIDAGITLFDTADVYGGGESERFIGEVLGPRRKDVVLATKFGLSVSGAQTGRADRRYVMDCVDKSLMALKTDWIDLYQVHRPDPNTPIEETLRALDHLVRQGKVRHIGCSNFEPWRVVDADWTAKVNGLARFISCQDEYSLINRGVEHQTLPAIRAKGLGLLPFFPLASGLLSGKYERGRGAPPDTRLASPRYADRMLNDRNFDLVEALEAFAAQRGHSLLELAFGWLLSEPALSSVIAGATKPAQVDSNVAAASWKMTPEEAAGVRAILDPPASS